jgi:hypothetical protein
MADEPPKDEKKNGNGGVAFSITGSTLLLFFLAVPMVFVWLYLALEIIGGAIRDPSVLSDIEGLLTALAVLTIPVMKVIDGLIERWKLEIRPHDTHKDS